MSSTILAEYENYDFGFTAVDSEETIVEKPVLNTQEIVKPVNDELLSIKTLLYDIYSKVDTLEELVKAGTGNFDSEAYKELLDKESADKLKKLEGLILPLLLNLMKNHEKDTIKWPNRKTIIEDQIAKILAITRPK